MGVGGDGGSGGGVGVGVGAGLGEDGDLKLARLLVALLSKASLRELESGHASGTHRVPTHHPQPRVTNGDAWWTLDSARQDACRLFEITAVSFDTRSFRRTSQQGHSCSWPSSCSQR